MKSERNDVIKFNDKYSGCIESFVVKETITADEAKVKFDKAYCVECDIHNNGKSWKAYCVGGTKEECLEVVFKQKQQWTYCNGTNIFITEKNNQKDYEAYFHGDSGVANYSRCGGDMW